jgi:hypothetical protein
MTAETVCCYPIYGMSKLTSVGDQAFAYLDSRVTTLSAPFDLD